MKVQRFITDTERAAREEFRTAYSQTHGADIEALIRGAQETTKAATQEWSEWKRAREAAAEEMNTVVKTFRSRDRSVDWIAQYLGTGLWESGMHLGVPLQKLLVPSPREASASFSPCGATSY